MFNVSLPSTDTEKLKSSQLPPFVTTQESRAVARNHHLAMILA